MKKQIMILFAMVFSIGLSAQTINNLTSCNYDVTLRVQTTPFTCGPSLGTMTISINPGTNAMPTLPPGFMWFAAEISEPSGGPSIVGVASACSSCGHNVMSGSSVSCGNIEADWSACGILEITN